MKKRFLGSIAVLTAMTMAVLAGCGGSSNASNGGQTAETKEAASGDAASADWTWDRNIESFVLGEQAAELIPHSEPSQPLLKMRSV